VISKATLRHFGTSPQKVRLVVDQVRGMGVEEALGLLRYSPKASARELERLLKSAVANAEQREERVDVDALKISRAFVDPGPTQKRIRFRSMGRAFRIHKRACHVTFELDLKGRKGAPPAPAAKSKAAASVTGGAKAAPSRKKPAVRASAPPKRGRAAAAKPPATKKKKAKKSE
jgi:large subunit ribosomal protein L22